MQSTAVSTYHWDLNGHKTAGKKQLHQIAKLDSSNTCNTVATPCVRLVVICPPECDGDDHVEVVIFQFPLNSTGTLLAN